MKSVIHFSAFLMRKFEARGFYQIVNEIAQYTIEFVGGIKEFEKLEKEILNAQSNRLVPGV